MTSLNYEIKITGNGSNSLYSTTEIPPNYSLDDLKHALLYIKFKVPYDKVHRFETYGFIKKKFSEGTNSNKKFYFWEDIDVDTTNTLIKEHIETVQNYGAENKSIELVRNFLEEYPE